MTTYQLDLREADEVDGKRLATRVLATLTTEDAPTMAATLRAVADRLDPPRPAEPVYRTREVPPHPRDGKAPSARSVPS